EPNACSPRAAITDRPTRRTCARLFLLLHTRRPTDGIARHPLPQSQSPPHHSPPVPQQTGTNDGRSRPMLVLSRLRDETIMIGDEIEITVVDIRGDKVRLGINAPGRIAVHRKEVYDAIKAENQRAAQINNSDLPTLR